MVLHIGAVLFYLVRRKQNLVLPMLSGDKALTAAVPASIDTLGARLRALAIFAAVAAIVTWLVRLGD